MSKQYIDRRPVNNVEKYLDDISNLTARAIKENSISEGSIVRSVIISQTPKLAFAENKPLSDRHTLKIVNDSSFLIYYGYSDDMEVGVDAVLINSGTTVVFGLNTHNNKKIYLVAPDIDVEVKIEEIS